MTKRILAGLLSALLLTLSAGCGKIDSQSESHNLSATEVTGETIADSVTSPDTHPAAEAASKDKLEDLTKHASKTDIARSRDSWKENVPYNEFSLALLRQNLRDGTSTLVSPLSVLNALGIAANGADSETLSELQNAFGMELDDLNWFLSDLRNNQNDSFAIINNANSLWLSSDRGFQPEQSFLDSVAQHYDAEVYATEFDNSLPEKVNRWVSKNTNGMIDKMLDTVGEKDIAYLMNALAFEAEWETVYYDYQVKGDIFTREDGTKVEMPLMFSNERGERCYLSDDNAEGFLKPYAGGKYAFAALLPNEGMTVADYLKTLNGEKLTSILKNADDTKVDAKIPKFESDFTASLNDSLQGMGITRAFDANAADFSKMGHMDTGENIYISSVLHKTFISVAEQGTKAGAATYISLSTGNSGLGEEEPPKEIYLDRPFVYMIVNLETNIPLFIGTYMGEAT